MNLNQKARKIPGKYLKRHWNSVCLGKDDSVFLAPGTYICIDVVLYMLTSVSVPPSVGSQGLLSPSPAPGIRLRGWVHRWSVSQVVVWVTLLVTYLLFQPLLQKLGGQGWSHSLSDSCSARTTSTLGTSFSWPFHVFLTFSFSQLGLLTLRSCVSIFNKLLKHFLRTKIS